MASTQAAPAFNLNSFVVPQSLPPPAWYPAGGAFSPLVLGLAVVALLVLVALAARMTALHRLRHRLVAAGWVLYTTPGCGACRMQLDLLGGKYPQRVECTAASTGASGAQAICAGLPAFPTWYNTNTGAKLEGAQDPATLALQLV